MTELCSDQLVAWVGRYLLPHEPALRAWLRLAFPNIEVEDVVQEAYCRIAALDAFDHVANPRQYFFRTARNVVLDEIRRNRVVSIETAVGLSLEEDIPEDAPSPERIAAARSSLARVEDLISALPDRARRIFRLRKIEGMSQREIASRLGVSEIVVENEVSRGLRRILDLMTEEERADLRPRPKGRRHARRRG